jgi:hypothetical protein
MRRPAIHLRSELELHSIVLFLVGYSVMTFGGVTDIGLAGNAAG